MVIQQRGLALGTDVLFTLNVTDKKHANSILAKIRNYLSLFECRFSRFKADSELNLVNKSAGSPLLVSDDFLELVKICNKMQILTGNLFNPFILPDLQRAGYEGTFKDAGKQIMGTDFKTRFGDISGEKITVRQNAVHINDGLAIDFGGIGKGYALDKLADLIEANDCFDYWVSLGGDIIGWGSDSDKTPWEVELSELQNKSQKPIFHTLSQTSRNAVATSSVSRRKGKGWHHIIDPRTRMPTNSSIKSAVVVAKSGVLADITAKCLIISGDKATEFWHEHQQIAGYIQYDDKFECLN